MSSIDRLDIFGIRAFDPNFRASIKFQTPLTLIVGYNGSGKTTIIECLKYVTTGIVPPGTGKGAIWVHDLNLAGEKEVLGQVKLRFRNGAGVEITCARTLQLLAKRSGSEFHVKEGSINLKGDGYQRIISSTRCQLDTAVPAYLGVSRAILDSVIFCHQDESLWPLGKASELKKRFDEIFEAQKYTKAIDNIKILRKQQAEKLIGHKKDEEYLKVNKHKGEDIQKRCKELHEQVQDIEQRIKDLTKEMSEAAAKAESAFERANKAGDIVYRLEGKRIEERSKLESVDSLRQSIRELEGSDDSLQDMLSQYEERMSALEDDLNKQREQYGMLGLQVAESRDSVGEKERECGSHEAQRENHDRRIEARKKLIKETAHRHEIRGFDMELDEGQIVAFMDRITKMARDQNAAFERARRETQEELQGSQKVLNQIHEQKTTLTSRKESARQVIASNDTKTNNIRSQLNAITVDEGGKAAMESALQELRSRLQTAKGSTNAGSWHTVIKDSEAELRQLEDQKQQLEDELVEATRRAGDSARLDFLQKELVDRGNRLETMVGAHGDRIGNVIGTDWQPLTVKDNFQRAIDQAKSLVLEAQRQRDGTGREMEQLDFKLSTCRSDLKSKNAAIKSATAAITQVIEGGPEEYSRELTSLEQNRNIVKSDADSFGMMLQYFDQCIKDAEEHKVCRTCTRGFSKDKDVEALKKSIDRQRRKFDVNAAAKDLQEVEDQLQAAKAVGPQFDLWERFKEKEIPALESDERKLSDQREALLAQLESQDATVGEKTAAQRDIEAVTKTVETIFKYASEMDGFKTNISELSAQQKEFGLSRGLEIIQEESAKVKGKEKTVKARLSNTRNEKEKSDKTINMLELEVRDAQSKLSTADYELKEKRSLEVQIEDLKAVNEEHRQKIRTIDQDLQGLAPQLLQARAKYDDIARRGQDRDRELQADASKLNNSLNQLKVIDHDIQDYSDRGGPEQLRRARQQAQTLKDEVANLEAEQKHLVRDVKALEDQLHNHDDTKRSIVDNLRFRRDQRALDAVRQDIAELESHDAESEKDHYGREGQHWQVQHNKLSAAKSELVGQGKSKDVQLEEKQEEWKLVYKDAAKKYKEAHILVETTKACIEDLSRYGGALDKAIMKYHSLKMEEINRIIDDLWRKTYQGTDVDTILIKSDNENVKGNAAYNYRVCMVKQDTEMDMRARCSAGQKVLACIIIRLALAECFGTNFGLIALDEPTTNLDRDNIQALAQSLAEIIRVRKAQKNFQLIVITHDEEFLRYMNCSDYADVYWRVGRNEKQKSKIEMEQITRLM